MSIPFSSFLIFFAIITSFLATLTTSASRPLLHPDECMRRNNDHFLDNSYKITVKISINSYDQCLILLLLLY